MDLTSLLVQLVSGAVGGVLLTLIAGVIRNMTAK